MGAERPAAVLSALVGVASVSAVEGKAELAVEPLALALNHPATRQIDRDRAQGLLDELESELPPEVLAAATARGRNRELEKVVAEILESNADS